MSQSAFDSLDALVAKLPFHLDDVDAANAACLRWKESGKEADRRVVYLWTYCFIRRYYLVKFVQAPAYGPADLDELIDATFRKVEDALPSIKEPNRYANWVSVVCKNTFLNYLRSRRPPLSLEDPGTPQLVAEGPGHYHDAGMARLALLRAVERLPAYLRVCARLRFIEGMSYDEIADHTGHPLPRIRSYINKALKRFRLDDELMSFFEPEE